MLEILAPEPIPSEGKFIFLAGSIEMGQADSWQREVVGLLAESDWVILNPRRGSWDASWEQSIDHPEFRQQVEWELDGLERAEKILMYFDPKTKSPISLLELGLFARSDKLIVVCPEGFWRKGNVDVVCARYGIKQIGSIEAAIESL